MDIDRWNLLEATSRTFYLSIRSLPRGMGDALCLAYLMLRVSDYLEDSASLPRPEKIRLLHLWRQIIRGEAPVQELERAVTENPAPGEVDYPAAAAAGAILDQVRALPPALGGTMAGYVEESTLGMARWIERGPDVETEADMDDYMHEVAGRVGYLSTEVFAFYSPPVRSRLDRLMPPAREFGLALQTVNIIRGMRKDYERGWIYVPRSFCREAGIERSALFDPAHRAEAMTVLDRLVNKAERHLASGLDYLLLLPRREHRVRLACMWPLMFAARTVALSRGNERVLDGEVKIGRPAVRRIVKRSTLLGWSNSWVAAYTAGLMRGAPESVSTV